MGFDRERVVQDSNPYRSPSGLNNRYESPAAAVRKMGTVWSDQFRLTPGYSKFKITLTPSVNSSHSGCWNILAVVALYGDSGAFIRMRVK